MGISSESSTLLPQSDLHDSQLPNNKQQDLLLQSWKIPLILVYYGLCSSTLIVINKVAVHTVEAPVFILLLQLLFSAFTVKGCTIVGVLDAEGLQVNLWITCNFAGAHIRIMLQCLHAIDMHAVACSISSMLAACF